MAEPKELLTELAPVLDAWPGLAPDPDAMIRVSALMVAGVAPSPPLAAEPGEPQFRLLTLLWGAAVLAGYLTWSYLANWLSLHPVWRVVLLAIGTLSLLAPLILVPILITARRPATE